MKIFGLGHYSRTGKDTFGNSLVASLGEYKPSLRAAKKSFAWKLKQIAFELYAWDGLREPEFYETLEGAKFRDIPLPTIGKTPVQIWVDLGTPAVRENVYENTWIDYLLKSKNDLDVLIIPDVRFANEIAAIRELGGTLIKVVRPGYGPRKTVADRALVGYKGWDYVIGESGDINDLRRWASRFAHSIITSTPLWQTEASREAAYRVEVVEPWTPPLADKGTLKLDRATATVLMGILDRVESGDTVADTVADTVYEQLEQAFPQQAT